MSTLYMVEVVEFVKPTEVLLDVQVVHPDAMHVPATPGFALAVLWDASGGEGALGEEVDRACTLDAAWMGQHARAFVDGVEVELEREPPPSALRDPKHAYWKSPDGWLCGRMRVVATDPAWLSHLAPGAVWESTAFDAAERYDACTPARADGAEAPAAAPEVRPGRLPVPRCLFPHELRELKDPLVWFPKYGPKGYRSAGDAPVTEARLTELIGEVALFEGEVGVVLPGGSLMSLGDGFVGQCYPQPGEGVIGRAELNPRKRKFAMPLTIATLMQTRDPVAVEALVRGSSVTLKTFVFSPDLRPQIDHAGQALSVLVARGDEELEEPTCRLHTFLIERAEAEGMGVVELFAKVGGGMVTRWSAEKVRDQTQDLEAVAEADLPEVLLSEPWETWTIEIEATDAAWVEHLAEAVPFVVSTAYVEEAESWSGEPIRPR